MIASLPSSGQRSRKSIAPDFDMDRSVAEAITCATHVQSKHMKNMKLSVLLNWAGTDEDVESV